MALVIQNTFEFKSSQGYEYKVNIVQEGGAGSPITDMHPDGSGFTLNYTGDDQNRFEPIIGSNVSIPLMIKNSTHEAFVQSIIDAQEQEFFVIIYLKDTLIGTYRPFWRGLVLQDLIKIEDISYPYIFNLKATDGIGRLKDIEYSDGGIPYADEDTFKDILIRILNDLEISDLWGATETFLSNDVNFYELNTYSSFPPFSLGTSFDTLALSRVKNEAFQTEKDDGTIEFSSSLDVLRQILICFGARIRQVPGDGSFPGSKFEVVSINNYKDGVDYSISSYYKTGINTGFVPLAYYSSDYFYRLAGGVFNHIPPLQRVKTSYEYKQSDNVVNFLDNLADYGTLTDYGILNGGSGERLVFQGNIEIDYSPGAAFQPFYTSYEVVIKVGTWYLTGEGNIMSWVNTPAVYIVNSPDIYSSGAFTFSFSITTPDIIASGELSFSFNFDAGYLVSDNTSYSYPGTLDNLYLGFQLYYLDSNGDVGEGVREAIALNNIPGTSTLVGSNSVYETGTLPIGDAITAYDIGKIEVFNTSAAWMNASQWDTDGNAPYTHIEELRAIEILAGQRVPRENFDITVYFKKVIGGNGFTIGAAFTAGIETNGKIYVPTSISFNANFDETSGTYFEIDTLTTSVINSTSTSVSIPNNIPKGADNSTIRNRSIEFGQTNLNDILSISKLTTDVSAGDTDTSIAISDIGKSLLTTGDIVYLVSPYRRQYQELTVNADQTSGQTSLTITSTTWDYDFPIGSYLLFKQSQIKVTAGDVKNRIKTITSDYTVRGDYDTIVIDATSNTVTATLPSAPNAGDTYNIACLDSTYLADIDFNGRNFYSSTDNVVLVEGENLVVQWTGTQWIGG